MDERELEEFRKQPLENIIDMLLHGDAVRAGSELARRADGNSDAVLNALFTALDDEGMRDRYNQLKRTGQWRNSDAGMLILELTRRVVSSR